MRRRLDVACVSVPTFWEAHSSFFRPDATMADGVSERPSDGTNGLTSSIVVLVVSLLIMFRVMLGYQPHSGQDNWHGLHSAYGGDFEAQRHWMELTLNLPIGEWYWYDLSYWGLDYPPLSAYVSWICGWLSHHLVGPESVALETSRGYEDPVHKAFMRATVIFCDIAIYGTAVWYWTMCRHQLSPLRENRIARLSNFSLAMMQPAILLIDHGHFQYNTFSLGLSLWSFALIPKESFLSCIGGAICFCLALSFKQMNLYYAPAIFFYLLGRCFQDKSQLVSRFIGLGVTVVVTMAIFWWPFVVFGPKDTTALERAYHVFRRIIPLQRGLFEGKVSNLWCALSTKPIRIRDRIPERLLPLVATGATLLLAAPSCYRLFQLGSAKMRSVDHGRIILYGMTSSALSFFLASFQVHEKSLLLAVAPLSLLWEDDPTFVDWFSIIAAWTLWPLLVIDRLRVAYLCTMLVVLNLMGLRSLLYGNNKDAINWMPHVLVQASRAAMLVLHTLEIFITPPPHLPDIFPVLWAIVGCGFCSLAWVLTSIRMFRATKVKTS